MKFHSDLATLEKRVKRHMKSGLVLDRTSFVAEGAFLSGHVVLGKQASIWSGAVLREDIEPVFV